MATQTRNWHFELLRIFSMLLIVATHYFASDNQSLRFNSEKLNSWIDASHNSLQMSGQIGVTLFVLISAYFLSRSTSNPIPRLLRLWIQIFIYAVGCFLSYILVMEILHRQQTFLTIRNVLASVFPITMGTYWFMSAFFAMIILGPFMNKLINVLSRNELVLFIGILIWIVFIWRVLNPSTLQYFTDIGYFSTIYFIGGYIRKYENTLPTIKLWQVTLIWIFSYCICVLGTHFIVSRSHILNEFGYPANLFTAGPGASPFLSVIAGCSLFLWVSKLKVPNIDNAITHLILMFAPATLGVYLLHENFIFKNYLWKFVFQRTLTKTILGTIVVDIFSIMVIYLLLIIVSFIIYRCIVLPIIKLVPNSFTSKK